MSSNVHTVLVTGASGFLGAHVVDQLLAKGQKVKGTVRASKVSRIQQDYDAAYGPGQVEIIGIDDLLEGDFTDALQGVTAVLHLACPLPARFDPKTTFEMAEKGTLNVIKQALDAGIRHISVASSVGSAINFADPTANLTEKDWNPTTKEVAVAVASDPTMSMFAYAAAKAAAEKALWKHAENYADADITAVLGVYFMGPFAPAHKIQIGDAVALSSNIFIYNMLIPDSTASTSVVGYVDVRDVAASLIAGIFTPGKNRVLLTGEWFEFCDARDHIETSRPELKSRLPPSIPKSQFTGSVIDNQRALEILSLPSIVPWKKSLLDAVDAVIEIEKEWANAGVDVETVLRNNHWRTYNL